MPRVVLTDRFCDGAKARDVAQVDFFDAKTPGLSLRVTRHGAKTWSFLFSTPVTAKRTRITLGTYPATSLAAARTVAIEARGHLEDGQNPRNILEQRRDAAMTVADLVAAYMTKHARPNLRTAAEINRRLQKNVLPRIGAVKLADLHRRDIARVVDPVLARGAPIEAMHIHKDLQALFRWAVRRGDLDHDPAAGTEKPRGSVPRERVLSDDEIYLFWNGIRTALARSVNCQRILKLCLITGQRIGEVAGMRVTEVDLGKGIWSLPGSRTKNKYAHVVPLPELALGIIRDALQEAGLGADYAFLNGRRDGPLPPLAVTRTLARALAREAGGAGPNLTLPHFTPHDLRRTAITGMARLGVAPIVLGHVANHRSVSRAGVTLATYQHYDYDREKREALALWADRIDAIVNAEPRAAVVPAIADRRRFG